MKKLVVVLGCLVALSTTAEEGKFFNQKGFDKDTKVYQQYKPSAKQILDVLEIFKDDLKIKNALDYYSLGEIKEWKKLISYLKTSREQAENLNAWGWFSECKRLSANAELLWTSALDVQRDYVWDEPKNLKMKMYKQVKSEFISSFNGCKKSLNAPKRDDYYSKYEPINLAEEK